MATVNHKVSFLVTGDLHWTGRNPKARTDSYKLALISKINEIYKIANDNSCSGIIIPGDLFDSVGAALSIINELGKLFQESPVPILTIHGGSTHGVYGGNPNTKPRTPYGILSTFNAVYDLTEKVYLHNEDRKIFVEGHGYDVKITDKNIKYYLTGFGEIKNDIKSSIINNHSFNILVTHGMLLDKSPGYEIRHTLMSDIAKHSNAPDVLINGHYHAGTGIKKINKTLFINPGSIGRIKASIENLNRTPQVVLLTIPVDSEPTAEFILLESAVLGEKVLSREHIEEEKRREEMTEKFLGLLAEEGQSNYMKLEEIMKDIAGRKEIPKFVIDEAMARLEKVREEMEHEKRTAEN